jgi:MerR family transcriptional regulator, repressor of the yfmOP operon
MDDGELIRIGELAKRVGVTTRTLRYWEEIGLIAPSTHRCSGERVYPTSALERVTHIRELQALVGFTLTEIRAVLETEEILDRLRTVTKTEGPSARRRKLLDDAIEANDRLVERLDDRLARLAAFRDERAAKVVRLRAKAAELAAESGAERGGPKHPRVGPAQGSHKRS